MIYIYMYGLIQISINDVTPQKMVVCHSVKQCCFLFLFLFCPTTGLTTLTTVISIDIIDFHVCWMDEPLIKSWKKNMTPPYPPYPPYPPRTWFQSFHHSSIHGETESTLKNMTPPYPPCLHELHPRGSSQLQLSCTALDCNIQTWICWCATVDRTWVKMGMHQKRLLNGTKIMNMMIVMIVIGFWHGLFSDRPKLD